MLGPTHRAFAAAWWLAGTLTVDAVAALAGHLPPVHPVVVLAGVVVAPLTAAGRRSSPDMDQRWAPGPPRHSYEWRGHRGWTHRAWFASVLTVLVGVVPYVVARTYGVPGPVAVLVFAPVAGWWSHLVGDTLYGRLPLYLPHVRRYRAHLGPVGWVRGGYRVVWVRHLVGLGWQTGGVLEKGGPVWRDPAAKVFMACSDLLLVGHLVLLLWVA